MFLKLLHWFGKQIDKELKEVRNNKRGDYKVLCILEFFVIKKKAESSFIEQ